MAAQIMPKELRLNAPPTMPQARSYMFKQSSVEQTVTFGNTVTINIPRLQRSYLTKDSYLRFDLKVTTKNQDGTTNRSVCWDTPGAFGAIDKIEVFDYLGSTLLESISGHGQLMALLMDTSTSRSELGNHFNTISGTSGSRSSLWRDNPDVAADVPPLWGAATYSTTDGPTSGQLIAQGGIDSTVAYTVTRQYSIPLLSFLGLLSPKFVPLHNGFTIVLTLNSLANALGSCSYFNSDNATPGGGNPVDDPEVVYGENSLVTHNTGLPAFAPDCVINNIYYCCQILELGPLAESMLLESTQGEPLVVPAKTFRNYTGSIKEGDSTFRLDLNMNVASLTNILWMMRPTSYLNDGRYRCLSNRTRNFLQNWWFQYGSSVLPQTSGINAMSPKGQATTGNGFTEAYVELMKSRHAWNQPSHDTLINAENFTIDETVWTNNCTYICNEPNSNKPSNQLVAGTPRAKPSFRGPYCPYLTPYNISPVGKFAAGIDLELVSGKSNEVVCGLNTNGMNTSIYGTFDSDYAIRPADAWTPHVRECRVDAWAEYDAFINVSPGIVTTISF